VNPAGTRALLRFTLYFVMAALGVVLALDGDPTGWVLIAGAAFASAMRGLSIWLRRRHDRGGGDPAAQREAVVSSSLADRQRQLRLVSITYISTFVVSAMIAAALSQVIPDEYRFPALAVAGILTLMAAILAVLWFRASRKLNRDA
jgi:hypothetical protein